MEAGYELRLREGELAAQELGEQVVVAEPLPALVERDDELVPSLEIGQERGGAGALERRVAQRAAQPLEDRRVQEEVAHRWRLAAQDLLEQEVADVPMVAGELADEGRRVGMAVKGEARQVQARRPAFGVLHQAREVGGRQRHAELLLQQSVRLDRGEPEVVGAKLRELAARAEASRPERGHLATGEHDLRRGRQLPGEVGQRRTALTAAHGVAIVDEEQQWRRRALDGVDQRRQRRRARDPRLVERVTERRVRPADRLLGVRKEASGVVVVLVQRQPRDGAVAARSRPEREQRGLAKAGGRGDSGHPAGVAELLQRRPHDRRALQDGRPELALQKYRHAAFGRSPTTPVPAAVVPGTNRHPNPPDDRAGVAGPSYRDIRHVPSRRRRRLGIWRARRFTRGDLRGATRGPAAGAPTMDAGPGAARPLRRP